MPSKKRESVPYNIPVTRAAIQADKVQREFLSERRDAVCSAADPTGYKKSPEDFVYTKDHCRNRSTEKKKTTKKPSTKRRQSDDTKEIERIQQIIDLQYPKNKKGDRIPKDEKKVQHLKIVVLSSMMVMPYYRDKFPDPEERYMHIKNDVLHMNANPRLKVMVLVQNFLTAINSKQTSQFLNDTPPVKKKHAAK